jgi:TorA maturation chaperone TorD
MDMSEIAQVNNMRAFFYGLIKKAFYDEPSQDYLDILKIFGNNLNNIEFGDESTRLLAETVNTVFSSVTIESVKDEYNSLLIDPFSKNLINKNASYYIDKKNFGNSLVNIREFMKKLGVEKPSNFYEPEDSVSFICDLMLYLIQEEEDVFTENQVELFDRFVEPLFLKLSDALKNNEGVHFYAGIGLLIDFFLSLEKSYLPGSYKK